MEKKLSPEVVVIFLKMTNARIVCDEAEETIF